MGTTMLSVETVVLRQLFAPPSQDGPPVQLGSDAHSILRERGVSGDELWKILQCRVWASDVYEFHFNVNRYIGDSWSPEDSSYLYRTMVMPTLQ